MTKNHTSTRTGKRRTWKCGARSNTAAQCGSRRGSPLPSPGVTSGSASPFTPEGELPTRRGEGGRRPVDVRRHRAALRPGQPGHDVPHGRGLAAAHGRAPSACPPAPRCSTWRAAPATCAASWPAAGSGPIGVDLCFGMLAAARTDAPLVHGRRPAPARARRRRSTGSRAGSPCATSSTSARSSPSWPGWCAPAAASRCSRWPSRRTGSCGGATRVYFGKVVPRIGALLSDGDAYRYLPKSVAYLPEPPELRRHAARRRLRRRRAARLLLRRHRPAPHGDPRPMTRCGAVDPRGSTATSTCSAAAGRRRRACSSGAASGSPARGVAAAGAASPRPDARPRRHRGRRRGRPARLRAGRVRRPAVRPRRLGRRRARRPRASSGAGPTTAPGGSPPSARPTGAGAAAAAVAVATGAEPSRVRRRAARCRPPSGATLVADGHQGASPTARFDKVVLAREVEVVADAPVSVARRRCAGCGSAYPSCFVSRVDGFVGASPELLVGRSGDVVRAHPMAGTAPRGGDPAADARLAAGAARLAEGPPRAPDHHRHGARHAAAAGARTSTTRPSRRSWPWPTCSTSPRWSRAGCRTRRRRCSSWWRPCTRPRRCAAGPATRRSAFIAELEGFDRGRYAGTVGWVDAAGNGQWAVGIRCAEVDGATGPGLRRQRHRRRLRSRHRAGRDPGQVPGHARRPRPPLMPQRLLSRRRRRIRSAPRRHRRGGGCRRCGGAPGGAPSATPGSGAAGRPGR